MAIKIYDVFISYNHRDQDLAKQIAKELKVWGLKVWFDDWELKPGSTWQEGLTKGLMESNSTAILIGPSGIGDWEAEEVRSALQRYVKQGSPIIPILLPGASKNDIPPFLDQRTLVDCSSTQISQRSIDRLIWGITEKSPTRSISQMGDEFYLKTPDEKRKIKLLTLPNSEDDRLVYLTWETFGKGIEILLDQKKNYGKFFDFDACFGINDAGLVMATFFNAASLGRKKIGNIRHRWKSGRRVIENDTSFFPKLPEEPMILLMDFEVKSGKALKTVIKEIQRRYPKSTIYFSAFGALTEEKNLKIESFNRLTSWKNISELGIEGFFIACTMHPPGIEPPLCLR